MKNNRVLLNLGIAGGGILYRYSDRIYVDKYIQNKKMYDILYPEIKNTLLPTGYAMFTHYWNILTGWQEDIYVKIPPTHICNCINNECEKEIDKGRFVICNHCLRICIF